MPWVVKLLSLTHSFLPLSGRFVSAPCVHSFLPWGGLEAGHGPAALVACWREMGHLLWASSRPASFPKSPRFILLFSPVRTVSRNFMDCCVVACTFFIGHFNFSCRQNSTHPVFRECWLGTIKFGKDAWPIIGLSASGKKIIVMWATWKRHKIRSGVWSHPWSMWRGLYSSICYSTLTKHLRWQS